MRVRFEYITGIPGRRFSNPVLWGSWDARGAPDQAGSAVAMQSSVAVDGTQVFSAEVDFPLERVTTRYRWGVRLDGPGGTGRWSIVHEVNDESSRGRHRTLVLKREGQVERYYLSRARHLGANKAAGGGARFAVWAPNAEDVEVVFGEHTADGRGGYIADNGTGIVADPVPMVRAEDGVWTVDARASALLRSFSVLDHRPYMYRLRKAGAPPGVWSYRTDLYSRCQIGKGRTNPEGAPYAGSSVDLDGSVSCSVVVDPDRVTRRFIEPDWPETEWLSAEEFWASEFDPAQPLPTRLEDLVIYELHVGGLGFRRRDGSGNPLPGTFEDALLFLDYLSELGINAIELLPMAEFDGSFGWGYATSHYFAVEFSGGGRDQLKHFVRACHRRGIAVILDVVYNHYTHHAERSQWAYDADAPERNIYFWYEGSAQDYADPTGGYLDNMSTAWAPRYWDETVRSLFVSSALALVTEFHIDGFRVDQTTSIHAYNVLHADGRPVGAANTMGAKLLREWTNALRLVSPCTFLIAEDHSGWGSVTLATDEGGLGFDATWYAEFYHHLAGDTDRGTDTAKLLTTAAALDAAPLAMGYFAGALRATGHNTVVYHESHDEAGNSRYSGRTLAIAVGRAPLQGDTRRYAEARCRFAAGMTLLSAGIPMFFMGEEVGFANDYTYDKFAQQKEDFETLRAGPGARLFAFYRALVGLRLAPERPELRAGSIDVFHVNDGGRTLAFLRTLNGSSSLVVATLSNAGFDHYDLRYPSLAGRGWREVFNSDSETFGGWGATNGGSSLVPQGDVLSVRLPRAGFVLFETS